MVQYLTMHRKVPMLLLRYLNKAKKENWSRDVPKGFTKEEIRRVSKGYVFVESGDKTYKFSFKDLNRRELEEVYNYVKSYIIKKRKMH